MHHIEDVQSETAKLVAYRLNFCISTSCLEWNDFTVQFFVLHAIVVDAEVDSFGQSSVKTTKERSRCTAFRRQSHLSPIATIPDRRDEIDLDPTLVYLYDDVMTRAVEVLIDI